MKQANRLIKETSPYLRQHAYNPVDWRPWGDEAMELAGREDKPILVSIGYAACHWCHVMERESFEDEETARIMNKNFVNIKVDREERPDIDHLYMDAVQAMTGAGGWPLNVFLTPEGRPFYGGTYFPPVRAYNRISWKETLQSVATAYRERRDEIDQQALQLTTHLEQAGQVEQTPGEEAVSISARDIEEMYRQIMRQADTTDGGFGGAPKFPGTFVLQFLLRYYHSTGEKAALSQACLSLDKMIAGGLYDQLGGGFARYSTDAKWLVPHFEKMLYDNALLTETLCEAYQLTGKEHYAKTIRDTLTYIKRELMSPEGGFYSSLDADSEGVEGKYYIWSKDEIEVVLGEKADLFCRFFNVTEAGNWEGNNILHYTVSPAAFAQAERLDEATWPQWLDEAREQLLEARQQRERPLLDNKILLNWNALMLSACCMAYAALGEDQYREMAIRNASFIERHLSREDNEGAFLHSYKTAGIPVPAFLDDYAFYIRSLLKLQEITADTDYLLRAKSLAEYVITHFSDEEDQYFYFTPEEQKDVIVRKKEIYDGATPSGNAVMAENLERLGILLDKPDFRERARKMKEGLLARVTRYPVSLGVWARACQDAVSGIPEIVIVGKNYQEQLKKLLKAYLPARILMASEKEDARFPLLKGKTGEADYGLIYLCRDYSCQAPVKEVSELLPMLTGKEW